MKVTQVETVTRTYQYVTTDDYWNEHRRWGPECWETLMGMSWEQCDEDRLEGAYQKFVLDSEA